MSPGERQDTREVLVTTSVLVTTGLALTVVLTVTVGSFSLIWNHSPWDELAEHPGGLVGAIGLFVGGALVHEVIHALSWKILAGVSWTDLSVTRSRRKLGVIVAVSKPIPLGRHRVGLVIPALLLGVTPMAIGLVAGIGLVLLWGGVFLFESFSDLAIWLGTAGVSRHLLVVDAPKRLGCRVVA